MITPFSPSFPCASRIFLLGRYRNPLSTSISYIRPFVHQTTSAFVAPLFWSHLHNTNDQCVLYRWIKNIHLYRWIKNFYSSRLRHIHRGKKTKIFYCIKQVFLLHHLRTLRHSPRIVPCLLIKNCQGRYCHRQPQLIIINHKLELEKT